VRLLKASQVTRSAVAVMRAMSGQHPHSPHSQPRTGVFGPIALVSRASNPSVDPPRRGWAFPCRWASTRNRHPHGEA
jgi:hypothetical protein